MGVPEPINCLAVESMPMAFRWRGELYEVASVIRSWCGDDEWWNSCYFRDAKFWLVAVKNSGCCYQLRHDPDDRWWILRDLAVTEAAAAA